MLVELSVAEQRYHTVMEVLIGARVAKYLVSGTKADPSSGTPPARAHLEFLS
ncbi:hypothetical protein [Nocardia sp. NPDC002869]|uniref:hypothetical protein n=1 Tax=Nocardia sp. NPDC002869 TaxID=3161032 RepID=UPI00398D2998